MNEFLSIFLTWQFLVLCIGISSVTFVIRAIIEYVILNNPKMPGNSSSRFWRDLVLVILPICLGFLFAAIAKSFPYPTAIDEPYSKFLFSSSAGLLSPTLYRVIKALLWNNVPNNAQQVIQQIPIIQNLQNQDPVVPVLPVTDSQDPEEPKV